jgi:hypothetical protein
MMSMNQGLTLLNQTLHVASDQLHSFIHSFIHWRKAQTKLPFFYQNVDHEIVSSEFGFAGNCWALLRFGRNAVFKRIRSVKSPLWDFSWRWSLWWQG